MVSCARAPRTRVRCLSRRQDHCNGRRVDQVLFGTRCMCVMRDQSGHPFSKFGGPLGIRLNERVLYRGLTE